VSSHAGMICTGETSGMRQMSRGEVCLPTDERGRQGLVESGSDDERRRTAASHRPRARSEL
jgi:hypothetical protein